MQEEQTIQRLQGFDPRLIFKNAPVLQPGTGDFLVGGDTLQVLGRMAACYLEFRNEERRRYFKGVTVIAPSKLVWDVADETIHEALVQGIEDLRGNTLPPDIVSQFRTRVNVVRCERLDVDEVDKQVAAAGEQRVILIPGANKYRDQTLTQEWALGRAGALLSEDIWTPHAARLAAACLEAAKPQGSVVVFSVTGESLVKEANLQLLTDIEDLYPAVLGVEGAPDTDELFAKLAPRWVALATAGRESPRLSWRPISVSQAETT